MSDPLSMSPFSEVSCHTCFAYSAKDDSLIAQHSRQLCYALKGGKDRAIEWITERVQTASDNGEFTDIFGPEVTLVPVPGYAPWMGKNALWVGLSLALAMHRQGLGRDVATLVSRSFKVRKSATSPRDQRPTHRDHYDSLSVRPISNTTPSRITVVDDVLGRGATIMGTVGRLRECFPTVEIAGFAAIRVKSDLQDGRIFDPCRHRIFIGPNGVRRDP